MIHVGEYREIVTDHILKYVPLTFFQSSLDEGWRSPDTELHVDHTLTAGLRATAGDIPVVLAVLLL